MHVQGEMLATIAQWAEKQPRKVMDRLTKQAVRNHENIRLAGEGGAPEAVGSFAQTQGLEFQNKIGGYLQGVSPRLSRVQRKPTNYLTMLLYLGSGCWPSSLVLREGEQFRKFEGRAWVWGAVSTRRRVRSSSVYRERA